MSSGFISEVEIAEKRKVRQEEWEKVRKPDQPIGKYTVFVLFVKQLVTGKLRLSESINTNLKLTSVF